MNELAVRLSCSATKTNGAKTRCFKDFSSTVRIEPQKCTTTCDVELAMEKDAATQSVPEMVQKSTQEGRRKVNSSIQYETQNIFDDQVLNGVFRRASEFAKKSLPIIESALIQNNASFDSVRHDSFSGNSKIKGSVDSMINFVELRIYTVLNGAKGKKVSSIDWHPTYDSVVAMSTCSNLTLRERFDQSLDEEASAIIIWGLDINNPLTSLKSPLECTVFRFNPTMPNIAVGGLVSGQLILWDISDHLEGEQEGRAGESQILPSAISLPELSHRQMVTDIVWLPSSIQVTSKGKLLQEDKLTDETHQFITVSGDGCIIIWDCRCDEGRKNTAATKHEDDYYIAKHRWAPISKLRVKKFESSNEIPLCSVKLLSSAHGQCPIICTSETGDLVKVNLFPSKDASSQDCEKVRPGTANNGEVTQNYVQWIRKGSAKTIAIDQSPFLEDILLTVAEWSFQIWNTHDQFDEPVYLSPDIRGGIHLTGGCFLPTGPGCVLVSKSDGSVDVWNFADCLLKPMMTVSLSPIRIESMAFRTCISIERGKSKTTSQLLAIGSDVGNLRVLELQGEMVAQKCEMNSLNSFWGV